jgi:hypothetical protein
MEMIQEGYFENLQLKIKHGCSSITLQRPLRMRMDSHIGVHLAYPLHQDLLLNPHNPCFEVNEQA